MYDDPQIIFHLRSVSFDRRERIELGERFPDMTKIYDANLNQIIEKTAAEEKIILKKGVYLQTSGPKF